MKLTSDVVRGRFSNRASAEKDAHAEVTQDEGRFHRARIENFPRMATQISLELLIDAYARGFFPMAVGPRNIRWFSPDPRGVIPLDGFRIPRGARKTLIDPAWEIRVDSAFEPVMRACADRPETWIDDEIIAIYLELHRRGVAHSVEVWRDGMLAGGLYGVRLGAAFFGESMFHRVTGASKVALVALHRVLVAGGFRLLDIQWTTPHLEKFGSIEIPKRTYLKILSSALQEHADFSASAVSDGNWRPAISS